MRTQSTMLAVGPIENGNFPNANVNGTGQVVFSCCNSIRMMQYGVSDTGHQIAPTGAAPS